MLLSFELLASIIFLAQSLGFKFEVDGALISPLAINEASSAAFLISVSTDPGNIFMIEMLCLFHSILKDSMNPFRAALVAQYSVRVGAPKTPAIDDTATTRPSLESLKSGKKCLQARMGPKTFTENISFMT